MLIKLNLNIAFSLHDFYFSGDKFCAWVTHFYASFRLLKICGKQVLKKKNQNKTRPPHAPKKKKIYSTSLLWAAMENTSEIKYNNLYNIKFFIAYKRKQIGEKTSELKFIFLIFHILAGGK